MFLFKKTLLCKQIFFSETNILTPYIVTVQIRILFHLQGTHDGYFIDLDFTSVNLSKLTIAIHGLEASSQSSYIQSLSFIGNKSKNFDLLR